MTPDAFAKIETVSAFVHLSVLFYNNKQNDPKTKCVDLLTGILVFFVVYLVACRYSGWFHARTACNDYLRTIKIGLSASSKCKRLWTSWALFPSGLSKWQWKREVSYSQNYLRGCRASADCLATRKCCKLNFWRLCVVECTYLCIHNCQFSG